MVSLSYLWSRKHYAIPYNTGRILAYIAMALLIYFTNELFLQNAEKLKELYSMGMLVLFVSVAWLGERKTLKYYKQGK